MNATGIAGTWLLPATLAVALSISTPVLAQQHRGQHAHGGQRTQAEPRRHTGPRVQSGPRVHHGSREYHGPRFHSAPRVQFGVVIGAPILPLWYSPPPRYYYPAPVVVQAAPPVYIERDPQPEAQADASAYWYFCRESNTYYPYVNTCPGEWQRVTPQPPPG